MKRSSVLFFCLVIFAAFVFDSCNKTCKCTKQEGGNTTSYEESIMVSSECSELNTTVYKQGGGLQYAIVCDGSAMPGSSASVTLQDNILVINGVSHKFDDNYYSESPDGSVIIDAFEEHPEYNTIAWLTMFFNDSQIGKKLPVKDMQKFHLGWMKDPAEGYNDNNTVEISGEDCTADSYVVVNKNNGDGTYTAEVHVTTLDNQTIVGKVICKKAEKKQNKK